MTSKKQRKNGYLLPDTVTGYDLTCVRLKIPDNPDYQAAFVGALHTLDKWWVWEKSYTPGDTRAAEAALYWRTLLQDYLIIDACSDTLCIDGFQADTGTFRLLISYDGGQTYVDAPLDLDPRHGAGFRLPLLGTADPRCDAAANMIYFLKQLIDSTVQAATNAAAASGAITIMLIFMPGIPIIAPIITAVITAILGIGALVVHNAFTQEIYDGLQCIFYCNIGNDGSVSASQLDSINAAINTQYPGTVEDVMYYILYDLWGEVGLTNAGAKGGQTGDCSGCAACNWCREWQFTIEQSDSFVYIKGNYLAGIYWDGITSLAGGSVYNKSVGVQITFPQSAQVTHIEMEYTALRGSAAAGGASHIDDPGTNTVLITSADTNHDDAVLAWNGNRTMTGLRFWVNGSRSASLATADTGTARLFRVKASGTGDDPYGESNCT